MDTVSNAIFMNELVSGMSKWLFGQEVSYRPAHLFSIAMLPSFNSSVQQ